MATADLAVLLLAAGAGRRFGGSKQLARIDGQTLIARACALADAVAPGASYVVLGANAEVVAAQLPASARPIVHADWTAGLGSSLAAGIRALDPRHDGVLVLLADQVAVRADAVAPMIERWRAAPDNVQCAHYADQPGVPAIFPRRLLAELAALSGERGAKPILHRETQPEQWHPMPDAAIDIDTEQDLLDWQASRTR
jgi:molybdenum cofactor cytidylyltransferase